MGHLEGLAAQAFQEIAGDGFAGGIADAVHQTIKLWPMPSQVFEKLVNLGVVTNVTIKNQRGVKVGRQFGDAALEALAHIAEGQFGPLRVAGLGNAIGNRTVGQNTGDQ